MAKITLELPYPPSINHYYGRGRSGQVYIKPKGKAYRKCVIWASLEVSCRGDWPNFRKGQPLSMSLIAYPPDKRRRDLDNILKALKDAMQHAHVYKDDCQIREYREPFKFAEPVKGGKVIVTLQEINHE